MSVRLPHRGWLFDLDGTVYIGEVLVPGAAETVAAQCGISRPTLRRWARLYRQGGVAALVPKPPGPQQTGSAFSPQIQSSTTAPILSASRTNRPRSLSCGNRP